MDCKFQKYFEWVKNNDSGVVYSKLWREMKDSFRDGVNRSYGINNRRDFSILLSVIIKLNYLKSLLNKFLDRFFALLYAVTSFFLTGDRKLYKKFGFQYAANIEKIMKNKNKIFFDFYSEYNKKFGEYYSYSGMRVFYYYFLAKKFIPKNKHRVLEIGAGMANFSIIHSRSVEEFGYVIVDIPEIIPASYKNVEKFMGKDVELFLPFEYEQFQKSTASKKIIWLLPFQMNMLEDKSFDFFCNTESFAEMPPDVSQDYWDKVGRLLDDNAWAFLVNRMSRFTGENSDSYSEMSSPFKLKSEKLQCKNIMIDEYRASIKKFREEPNLVSVYQCVANN